MDPFSVRVLTSLVFTLCLGSLIGYLWAASRSSRREAAGTERADEDDATATAGRVPAPMGALSPATPGASFSVMSGTMVGKAIPVIAAGTASVRTERALTPTPGSHRRLVSSHGSFRQHPQENAAKRLHRRRSIDEGTAQAEGQGVGRERSEQ